MALPITLEWQDPRVLIGIRGIFFRRVVLIPFNTNPDQLIEAYKHGLLKKVPRPTLFRWLRTGKLDSLRIGRRFYTTQEAVEDFLSRMNGGG